MNKDWKQQWENYKEENKVRLRLTSSKELRTFLYSSEIIDVDLKTDEDEGETVIVHLKSKAKEKETLYLNYNMGILENVDGIPLRHIIGISREEEKTALEFFQNFNFEKIAEEQITQMVEFIYCLLDMTERIKKEKKKWKKFRLAKDLVTHCFRLKKKLNDS